CSKFLKSRSNHVWNNSGNNYGNNTGNNAGKNTRNNNKAENVVETDNANNNGTNNATNNVVGKEDLPQLPDSKKGPHVTNVLQLDVEDFTSWKDRFLVYRDRLECFLLENFLPKPQKQWTDVDRRLANQDKR
ncbi:hypothetical protein Tco_0947004, partial [Tanacetum coccineum]